MRLLWFALLLLQGCVVTPWGSASIFWTTEYGQNASAATVKRFRDGEFLEGDWVQCDALKKAPPYSCECGVRRVFPTPAVTWKLPTDDGGPRAYMNHNYLDRKNAEPPSFDGHPRLQYAFSGRNNRVWFYDLGNKKLLSETLRGEPLSSSSDTSFRACSSERSYVHVGGAEVFYFSAVTKYGTDLYYCNKKGPAERSTFYRWQASGAAQAPLSPEGMRQFYVWRATLGADGVPSPFLIATQDGALARANPALYTLVAEEQLPAYVPNESGRTVDNCLATVRQGDICSYREHGIEGAQVRSEVVCEPFSEHLAEKVRRLRR